MTPSDIVALLIIAVCVAAIIFRRPYAESIIRARPRWLPTQQDRARTESWIAFVAMFGIALGAWTILSRTPMRGLEQVELDPLTWRDYIGFLVYVGLQAVWAVGSIGSRAIAKAMQVLTFVAFLLLLSYLPERTWPADEPFGLVVWLAGTLAGAGVSQALRNRRPVA